MTAPLKALTDMLARSAEPQPHTEYKNSVFIARRSEADETAHSYEIARRQWTRPVTDLRQWGDDREWPDAAQDGARDAQEVKDNQEDLDVWTQQGSVY